MTRDLISQLDKIMPTALTGSVVQTVGMTAAVAGLPAPVGALVDGVDLVVVRFDDNHSVLYGRCLHRGALMGDGHVDGDFLEQFAERKKGGVKRKLVPAPSP